MIKIENSYFKYYYFYFLFDQINVALVSIRSKKKKTFLNIFEKS